MRPTQKTGKWLCARPGLVDHLGLWPKAIRRALLCIVRPTQKTGVSKVYSVDLDGNGLIGLVVIFGDQHRKLVGATINPGD